MYFEVKKAFTGLCLSPGGVFGPWIIRKVLTWVACIWKIFPLDSTCKVPFPLIRQFKVSFYRVTDKQILNLSYLSFLQDQGLWSVILLLEVARIGNSKGRNRSAFLPHVARGLEEIRFFRKRLGGSLLYCIYLSFLWQQEDFNQENSRRRDDRNRLGSTAQLLYCFLSDSRKTLIMTSLARRWQKTAGVDSLPNFQSLATRRLHQKKSVAEDKIVLSTDSAFLMFVSGRGFNNQIFGEEMSESRGRQSMYFFVFSRKNTSIRKSMAKRWQTCQGPSVYLLFRLRQEEDFNQETSVER